MRTKSYLVLSRLLKVGKVVDTGVGDVGWREERVDDVLLPALRGRNYLFYVFLLVLEGEAEVKVNNHSRKVGQGDLLLFKPLMHIAAYVPSSDYRALLLLVDSHYFIRLMESTRFHGMRNRLFEFAAVPVLHLSAGQETELQLFWRLLRVLCPEPNDNIRSTIDYLLEFFLIRLSAFMKQAVASAEVRITHRDKIFQDFLQLLSLNYEQEHTVLFYAEQVGVTPAYLSRIVREMLGKTVHDLIAERLYVAACRLLASTDLTVAEIAERLNFADQSAFGKFFKKYALVSPLKYRTSKI